MARTPKGKTVTAETGVQNGQVSVEQATKAVMATQLLSSKVIMIQQDGIKKTIQELDPTIHANAVQCLMHAEKHGDTSLMKRLLVDIIDVKSGYRRAGLINWMRKHSPMELAGTEIKLNGLDAFGNKRKFNVEAAEQKPFYLDRDNDEKVARPVYRETLMSPITNAINAFRAAIANTERNGNTPVPKDASKPFFDGENIDSVSLFLDLVEKESKNLPADLTKERRKLAREMQKLDAEQAALPSQQAKAA